MFSYILPKLINFQIKLQFFFIINNKFLRNSIYTEGDIVLQEKIYHLYTLN
ncbi:MAG: hypothetical protein H6Q23_1829, partial [Bacteroidetes bacterium]|nr:hypothetical protein [Bacteroidota bacterium]